MKLALSKVIPGVSYAIGQVVDVAFDDVSPVTVVEIDAVDRAVLVVAVCTETLGGGYGPQFDIGTDSEVDAFIEQATLAAAVAGDTFIGAGLLTAGLELQVAVGDGGGGPGVTGAFRVTVIVSPTS